MKKALFIVLLGTFLFTGCAAYVAPTVPPMGLAFENVKAPLDVNVNKTKMSEKQGEASSLCVLWLFAFGDCSIAKAARNGNIKTINHADYQYTNILGFFQQFQVIVYGE